jgi:hypothetical protein
MANFGMAFKGVCRESRTAGIQLGRRHADLEIRDTADLEARYEPVPT